MQFSTIPTGIPAIRKRKTSSRKPQRPMKSSLTTRNVRCMTSTVMRALKAWAVPVVRAALIRVPSRGLRIFSVIFPEFLKTCSAAAVGNVPAGEVPPIRAQASDTTSRYRSRMRCTEPKLKFSIPATKRVLPVKVPARQAVPVVKCVPPARERVRFAAVRASSPSRLPVPAATVRER